MNKPMIIGIEGNGLFGWRGPSRNIRNALRALARFAPKNQYIVFVARPVESHFPKDSNITYVHLSSKRFIPWLNCTLPFTVGEYHLDAFLFPQGNFWFFKPVTTVVWMRSATIDPWTPSFVDWFSAALKRMLLKRVADRVLTVSHFNATQLLLTCGIPEDTIGIVNNGVDPVFLDETIEPENNLGRYLLFLGGNEERKNFNRTAQAFAKLISMGHDLKLVVVGGQYGSERATSERIRYTEELRIRSRVVFHGVETDTVSLSRLYRGALLTIYPSTQETFGMVAIEAMACGCPLIASYMPSIPEIAGDAAIYFDPYDPEDMTDKIDRVIRDDGLRRDLISRGRERVKRFSWEKSAMLLLESINSLIVK